MVEHTVEELVTQRVLGLALGYEDLNDHDTLRRDALLAAVVGKADPTGASRVRAADRGSALAGKSTLNRLELAGPSAQTDRYKKVSYDAAALDALLVDLFIEAHPRPPVRIVLDVDDNRALRHRHHGQERTNPVTQDNHPKLDLLVERHRVRPVVWRDGSTTSSGPTTASAECRRSSCNLSRNGTNVSGRPVSF